jgi:hypothetical protein
MLAAVSILSLQTYAYTPTVICGNRDLVLDKGSLSRAAELVEQESYLKEITKEDYHTGVVRHFVSFKFDHKVTPSEKKEVVKKFLALKEECLRNNMPYITSIETGKANSPEGVDQGMEIGFLVSFKSEGDRNYYVGSPLIPVKYINLYDHAHEKFKNFIGPLLATPIVPKGVFVFDFTVEEQN